VTVSPPESGTDWAIGSECDPGVKAFRDELLPGLRFALALPRFLRCPLTSVEARAELARRFRDRQTIFLETVRTTIYGRPRSPYKWLLARAGCEPGDLEGLVRQDGVEGALQTLYRQGVYLSVEEFKGRRPAIRGSASLQVDLGDLRNPLSSAQIVRSTGGSGGSAIPVAVDLAFIRDRAINTVLNLEARGGLRWRHGIWTVPGGNSLVPLLRLAAAGARPSAWFTLVNQAAPGLHWRYRASGAVLRLAGRLAGRPIPAPIHVPLQRPQPILRWMDAVRIAGGVPHLFTFVSSAARLCQEALATGQDLRGVQFTIAGEPVTPARLATIHRSGAEAQANYAASEVGAIGEGCLQPTTPDDVHLLHDRVTIVQPGVDARAGLPPRALLVSALRPYGPLTLLNVSLGDEADLVDGQRCCPLAGLGWTSRLRRIRSFEKLSAGGMTFLDVDITRVLEQVLPARFGGGPTHYQLVEEEDANGTPRLALLVDPAVGAVTPGEVVATFLAAIGQGGGAERVMALAWRDAGILRIERRPPLVTPSGKILHLHVARGASGPAARSDRPPSPRIS
jgi:hypothetical protein